MGAAVPKVLLDCHGPVGREPNSSRSILASTVAIFDSDPHCDAVVVCVPSDWYEQCLQEVSFAKCAAVVNGGATRQESVSRGISALIERFGVGDNSIVLVHDAARCCVSPQLIARVVEGVIQHGAVTAALPVADALCRAQDGVLTTYVDRESLWSIQTPQGFFVRDLIAAHTTALREGIQALDDAALVARSRPVHVVMGDRLNIKVTHPDDLHAAGVILSGGS